MKKSKIDSVIFLDVDGVLNDMADDNIGEDWDYPSPKHLEPLKEIVERTGASIVLTSSWRLIKGACKRLQEAMEPYGLTWIDSTRELGPNRGAEIRDWLHRHPDLKHFVILDDDVDGFNGCMANKFITTKPISGLLPCHVNLACAILQDSIDWDMEDWLV